MFFSELHSVSIFLNQIKIKTKETVQLLKFSLITEGATVKVLLFIVLL
jgi:hypothetical protein